MREREKRETSDETILIALEVYRVITEHLSHEGSKVILHTPGESLRTLHLRKSIGSHAENARTVYKSLNPPCANGQQRPTQEAMENKRYS